MRNVLDPAHRTIESTHYRQFTETVLEQHLADIKQELRSSPCPYASLPFDGTTWCGEVLGILMKYWKVIDGIPKIVIRAIAFFHSDSSLDQVHLAGHLMRSLKRIQFDSTNLVQTVHDEAAVFFSVIF